MTTLYQLLWFSSHEQVASPYAFLIAVAFVQIFSLDIIGVGGKNKYDLC